MIKNYEAVLFDLDGTLIDSMWMWHDIDVEYLASFGLEVPDDLNAAIEGMGFTETASYFKTRNNISDSLDKIKETWNNMARNFYRTKVPLKTGALEFLKYLKAHNIKTAIGTSNSIELATDVLEALNITEYFDTVITACMVNAGKPKPDIYLRAAHDLGVAPQKCIVFEDVPQGIMAGRNAGMTTVAVKDEYSMHLTDEKIKLAHYYTAGFKDFMKDYCN